MSLPLVDLGPLIALDPAAAPELAAAVGSAEVPVALLPVRLETRFAAAANGNTELLVRIYPDKIHIDAHDPRLSAVEAEAGRTYWHAEWRSGSDDVRLRAAWRGLADRFGPGRAAWIARRMSPTNAGARPGRAIGPDEVLSTEPAFPDPGPPAERTATPLVRLLPDRWTACAYAGGGLLAFTTGADVRPDLPVGPDLDAAVLPGEDGPVADAGMAWMIDFAEAERAGMALRLRLPGPVTRAQVDVLLVSGMRAGDPSAGATACADLLAAQRFTDGLAFLAPGTPSNNNTEERSGYASRDLRGERSFALEWRAAAVTDATNVGRSEAALGLAESDLDHLAGAADDQDRLPAAVQAALWPATWGYYLTQFVGLRAGRLTLDDLDWARGFVAGRVRVDGPLPAIRVGRQPYGVLPVTSLRRYAAIGADAARFGRLRDLLVGLRESVWRPTLDDVPRVGRGSDPNAALVDVLRTDARGIGLAVRRAMGPQYLQNLRTFLGSRLDAMGFWTVLRRITGGLPGRVGLGFQPSIGGLVWEPAARRVTLPLVPDDHREMINSLLADDLDALSARAPGSLFEAILRQSLLREHALAAARLLADQDRPLGTLLRDAELVDLGPGPGPTPGWSWQLNQSVPGSAPPQTVRGRLAEAPPGEITELRAVIGELATADGGALDQALRGALGVTSHRLDAWITAYATSRLAELRATRPTGLRVGGYGWLENLRHEPRTPVDPLPDEPGPLSAATDDPGFVHAPSLGQAAAAALLRNAHLAHGATRDGPYAINLTSERVRRALRLFDGIRQGQSLGALLGYDVERHVHDAGLDHVLDDLRRIAPSPALGSGEEAARRRVVLDGLELHRRWRDEQENLLNEVADLSGDVERRRLIVILNGLDAAIDAAADAVTAENVFQFARGNLARSGGSLDEIATGKAPPPSLEFMRTPRTGTAITHRLLVAVGAGSGRTAGWATDTPRALVEPTMDAWVSRLLGPATGVEVVVDVLATDGTVLARHPVPLDDLGLAALDLVWITGDNGATTELARHAYAVAVPDGSAPTHTALAGGSAEPALRLDLGASADRSRRGLADLLELAGRVRTLLAGARPLDGADLQPAHAAPERLLDLDEFESRAAVAASTLTDLHDHLKVLLAAEPPPSLAAVRAVLTRLAGLGVPGALTPLPGTDQDQLAVGSVAVPAVAAVLAETARRLSEAESFAPADDPEPDEPRRDRILRRIQAIFGAGFVACATFRVPTASELTGSMADPALLGEDRLAAFTWLQRMERVRPAVARLGLALREAEILGTVTLDLAPGQVPHVPGRPWLGVQLAAEAEGQDGQVSLVLAASAGVDLGRPLAGLLVDEWTEVVPSRTETTGIAFRFDPPDAVAPHAILLAVPPVTGEPWTVGTLHQVLLETLDLAHLRMVGPEHLGDAAHFLPATMLAFNVAGDVPSTDPNVLTG